MQNDMCCDAMQCALLCPQLTKRICIAITLVAVHIAVLKLHCLQEIKGGR